MDQLDLNQLPVLTVYNKADKIDREQFVPTLFPYVLISANQSSGKTELNEAIKKQLFEIFTPYSKTVTEEQGQLIEQIKRETLVISIDYQEENHDYLIKGFAQENSIVWREENKEEKE